MWAPSIRSGSRIDAQVVGKGCFIIVSVCVHTCAIFRLVLSQWLMPTAVLSKYLEKVFGYKV